MLYRQARGAQPFAGELATMRARLVEVVAGMLDHALRAQGREVGATDLEVVAYALVGASESLADWLADHPEADPEKTATRMMNVAWLGAAQLLHGVTWRPPDERSPRRSERADPRPPTGQAAVVSAAGGGAAVRPTAQPSHTFQADVTISERPTPASTPLDGSRSKASPPK